MKGTQGQALEAIAQRYTVYFINAHDLVQTLQEAHQRNNIQQKMKVFTRSTSFSKKYKSTATPGDKKDPAEGGGSRSEK